MLVAVEASRNIDCGAESESYDQSNNNIHIVTKSVNVLNTK